MAEGYTVGWFLYADGFKNGYGNNLEDYLIPHLQLAANAGTPYIAPLSGDADLVADRMALSLKMYGRDLVFLL